MAALQRSASRLAKPVMWPGAKGLELVQPWAQPTWRFVGNRQFAVHPRRKFLGAHLLALCFASFSVGRAGAVIGFFELAVRFGHEKSYLNAGVVLQLKGGSRLPGSSLPFFESHKLAPHSPKEKA